MYQEYIDLIQDKQIKELVTEMTKEYGNEELEKDAVNVANLLIFILKEDKIYNDTNYVLFVDILIAAALLHNITYKYGKDDYTNLFKTRQLLNKLNEEKEIFVPSNYIDLIAQPIEGQLGKSHPIALLIPGPNTPGYQFSLACSLYYKGNVTINS
jgi:hypothetical protein